MSHIKESTHWYDRDGTPRYEVAAKSGAMRGTTLRDARQHGWYPGVTGIIRCASAPGLENWKIDQAILSALTLPRIEGESNDSLLARIKQDSKEHARKAAERGTEIHAAIQAHYELRDYDTAMLEFVEGVDKEIDAEFGIPPDPWKAEVPCVNAILGYGTKADLSCRDIVLDFKGAEFDEREVANLKTWEEHHMQLAATDAALEPFNPERRCAIVYVSRNVPGLVKVCRVTPEELSRGWIMFQALLGFWKAQRGYYPELWTPSE